MIFFQVHDHAHDTITKFYQFTSHRITQTVDKRDTVPNFDDDTHIFFFNLFLIMLNALFNQCTNFFWSNFHCL